LKDLEIASYFDPILLSEEVGIEKPDTRIFRLAFNTRPLSVKPQECVHVGDELDRYVLTFRQSCRFKFLFSDYHGARAAGMHALLLRRAGPEGDDESKDEGENLQGVQVVNDLLGVLKWVEQQTCSSVVAGSESFQ